MRWVMMVGAALASTWAVAVVTLHRFKEHLRPVDVVVTQAPPTMIELPDALCSMLALPSGSKVPLAGHMLTGLTAGLTAADEARVQIIGKAPDAQVTGQPCTRCKKLGDVRGSPLLCASCVDILSSVMWAKQATAHFGLPAHELVDAEIEAAYEALATVWTGVQLKRCWTEAWMQLISDHQHGRVQG